MPRSFVAASGQIAPDYAVWPQDAQGIHALWRDIDPSRCGRSAHKKDVLRLDKTLLGGI
jgi:hypothetical protein